MKTKHLVWAGIGAVLLYLLFRRCPTEAEKKAAGLDLDTVTAGQLGDVGAAAGLQAGATLAGATGAPNLAPVVAAAIVKGEG